MNRFRFERAVRRLVMGVFVVITMLVLAIPGRAQNIVAGRNPAAGGVVELVNHTQGTSDTVPPGTFANLAADAGDILEIIAEPNPGWRFVRWDGNPPAGTSGSATFVHFADSNRSITAVFEQDEGFSIALEILPLGYDNLEGVGVGEVEVSVNGGPWLPYAPAARYDEGDVVRLRAIGGLVPNPGLGGDFQSFVFEWDGDIPETLQNASRPHPNTTPSFAMTANREITLLFSREYHPGEGVGDLDLDGLPDRWEVRHGLDPKDPTGANGAQGNPSGDFMPGGWTPGAMNRFDSGLYPDPADPDALDDINTNWPYRFPVSGDRPNEYYVGVIPFNNWFQARGFDGWYGVNPITGVDDRPGTDPNLVSTAGDGISDGWKYYFYGSILNDWDITQAAGDPPNLVGTALDAYTDPNNPVPTVDIDPPDMLAIFEFELEVDPSDDPDNDCVTLMEEFLAGTDPFHWDTDGDLISDGYEIRMGLNPLNPADANRNDSGDYMAFYEDPATGDEYRHGQVYALLGFDPRTGWGANYYSVSRTRTRRSQPNTVRFTNLEHYRASVYLAARQGSVLGCGNWDDYALNPFSIDTDGDGIFDGWELYAGLNPLASGDASVDSDGDGLSNFQEFSCYDLNLIHGGTWPNGRTHFDPQWRNKVWPTDPNNPDTDGDGLTDGAEGGYQNVEGGIGNLGALKYAGDTVRWIETSYVGGGLNPTAVDTDTDGLPDHWEARFRSSVYDVDDLEDRNGMDPTVRDHTRDYDGDGLMNYQEYLVGAVHHWRYRPDQPLLPDQGLPPGMPMGSHDPMMFFTGTPHDWDPGAMRGPDEDVPYFFMEHINNRYNSTDPTNPDSDGDGMDDYWKIYHGLNPTYGLFDLFVGMHIDGLASAMTPPTFDIRVMPFAAGYPYADPDQDGLPNWAESLQPNVGPPFYYHTDPSPLWVTDVSYDRSWVNLYYAWNVFQPWYFDEENISIAIPPVYMFSFAINEGFDTDGDFVGDRAELINDPASPGVSDPLSVETPVRRGALYLEGNSAARTRGTFIHQSYMLKNFTIEAWVRPENPAAGTMQVILERPFLVPAGSGMGAPETIRLNFRLALDPDGVPFVAYTGGGDDALYVEARAPLQSALAANEWVHLAGVYDGAAEQLRLYVNGQLQRSFPTAEVPFTGWTTGDVVVTKHSPMVVGAKENNPEGWVTGVPPLTGWPVMFFLPHTQPDLSNHFQGWVDEIRVWNGARTSQQIAQSMSVAKTMSDVQASLAPGGGPDLMYLYNFNDIHDPIIERVAPDGFELLNGRPDDGSYPHVPWWALANDRSLHYDNYHYVPWIANIAARIPLDPPADSPISRQSFTEEVTETVVVTNLVEETVNGETVLTEVVETNEVVTVVDVFNEFPNTANPYNMAYYSGPTIGSESHPEIRTSVPGGTGFQLRDASLFNDLLPLGMARADVTVELWDGMGAGGPEGPGSTVDANNDGIPDWWQRLHWPNFDPNATGSNPWDAHADPDGDGLTNLQEYLLGLDPLAYDSSYGLGGNVLSDYDRIVPGTGLTAGELVDDGDGMPYFWESQFPGYLDPERFDAFDDPDQDGWDNLSEYLAGTDPSDPESVPRPTVFVRVDWEGTPPDEVRWIAWDRRAMDGIPVARGRVADPLLLTATEDIDERPPIGDRMLQVTNGALVQGPNYFLFFADLDGSGEWKQGEPAGFPDQMPVHIGWGEVHGVRVGLSWESIGHQRLFWEGGQNHSDFIVRVRRNTSAGKPQIVDRVIRGRRYFHDYDFRLVGGMHHDLPNANDTNSAQPEYEWFVSMDNGVTFTNQGIFAKNWTESLSKPATIYPTGVIREAGRPFRWRHANGTASRFHIQIYRGGPSGPLVWGQIFSAPVRGTNGHFSYQAPLYLGGDVLDSGSFAWRIRALNPDKVSEWSDFQSFEVNTTSQPNGPFDIRGDLWYMGRANVNLADFIIQVYRSPGMEGAPFQQQRVSGPGTWVVSGLPAGTYYVRAFMDVDDDGKYAQWEPYGFLRDPSPYALDYSLQAVEVGPNSSSHLIIVRDVDTDNDGFSDAWEMQRFGNLNTAQAGHQGVYPLHSVETGNAVADLLPLNMALDSTGNGIPDAMEMVLGFDPLNAADSPSSPNMFTILGFNQVWLEFDLNDPSWSLNRKVGAQVQYTTDMVNWQDLPLAMRHVGPGVGPWNVFPGGQASGPVMAYRLRWFPLGP